MGLIVTLIVGGIIGWLASIIMKTNAQMGIIANVVIGIIGSMLGHWLAGMLGLGAGGAIVNLLVSIGGAVLLILVLSKLGLFKRKL